jgi:hypothetical protein
MSMERGSPSSAMRLNLAAACRRSKCAAAGVDAGDNEQGLRARANAHVEAVAGFAHFVGEQALQQRAVRQRVPIGRGGLQPKQQHCARMARQGRGADTGAALAHRH